MRSPVTDIYEKGCDLQVEPTKRVRWWSIKLESFRKDTRLVFSRAAGKWTDRLGRVEEIKK